MIRERACKAGDLLAAAFYYATRGWHVLPLHDIASGICSCRDGAACATPGKHPRLNKWTKVASTDTGTISGWWKVWPTANVGILTGRRSNLVVLDVDPRHGGDDALAVLLARRASLAERRAVLGRLGHEWARVRRPFAR